MLKMYLLLLVVKDVQLKWHDLKIILYAHQFALASHIIYIPSKLLVFPITKTREIRN